MTVTQTGKAGKSAAAHVGARRTLSGATPGTRTGGQATDARRTGTHMSRRTRRIGGWFAALLLVVLGGVGGYLVHRELPRSYLSSTTVLVLPTAAALDSSLAAAGTTGVEIDTEVQLMGSAQVAQLAAERLDGRIDATELLAATTVTVPTNSTVLEVEVEASDSQLAADAASAVAEAYLERRQAQADAEIAEVVTTLGGQVDRLTGRLQEITASLGTLGEDDDSGRALAESERSVVVSQLADVNSRLVALQAGTSQGGEVITEAVVPTSAASPQVLVDVGAGLAVGALLGGLLLLGLERLGNRRTASLHRDAALRDLGVLDLDQAEAYSFDGSFTSPPVASLVAQVDQFETGRDGPDVLVAVAPAELVLRLSVLLNQAWARDRGDNVLVLAQPGAVGFAAASSAAGLAEVVRSEVALEDTVFRDDFMLGSLLGPGRGTAQLPPAALRSRMTMLWQDLDDGNRGVLVVLVPPLDSVEAQSALRTAGRVVVAVHPGSSEEQVAGLFEDLRFLGLSGRVVGTVEVRAGDVAAQDGPDMSPDPAVRSGAG